MDGSLNTADCPNPGDWRLIQVNQSTEAPFVREFGDESKVRKAFQISDAMVSVPSVQ